MKYRCRLRPCIDIHNGKVKQIIGGSLSDETGASENFVSEYDAAFYSGLYKSYGLKGGHIIILNAPGTKEYDAGRQEAVKALQAYPGGFQIGGGLNYNNASFFLEMGADKCIFTSFLFKDGKLCMDRLEELRSRLGKERIVLDLSCRFRNGEYFVVADRWQTFTDIKITYDTFEMLKEYASEFLIHGVDVEGKKQGIDERLLGLLSETDAGITYAGGIHCMEDISLIDRLGMGRIDYTVGSGLDIFGGAISLRELAVL